MLVEQRPSVPTIDRSLRNGVASNGLVHEEPVSSYLQYLPGLYQSDPFIGRFLLIFESILGPIEQTIDQLANYLDPRVMPVEQLEWIASWVSLELDENWPIERRRELVFWAVRLYRWRGTRRGLREHLRLYTGYAPLIVENDDGLRLGHDGTLGEHATLSAPRRYWLNVTVRADAPDQVDPRVIRQIIEFQKPAHVGYAFEVRPAGGGPRD
jgi:phage tail-like protein